MRTQQRAGSCGDTCSAYLLLCSHFVFVFLCGPGTLPLLMGFYYFHHLQLVRLTLDVGNCCCPMLESALQHGAQPISELCLAFISSSATMCVCERVWGETPQSCA